MDIETTNKGYRRRFYASRVEEGADSGDLGERIVAQDFCVPAGPFQERKG